MRRYKNAIILLGAFIILLAVFLVFGKDLNKSGDPGVNTEASGTTSNLTVANVKKADVKQVELNYKGQKLVFTRKEEDQFILKEPVDAQVDVNAITRLTNSATNMSADKLLDKKTPNLADYGLDSPQAQVLVTMNDGKQYKLAVGNETPSQGSFYVMGDDAAKIYVVAKVYVEDLLVDLSKMKSKDLITMTAENVNYVGLEKNGKVSFAFSKQADSTWKSETAYEAGGDDNKLQGIIAAAISLSINEYVSGDVSNLAQFGLDNPTYAFELRSKDGKSVKVLLGKEKTRGKEIYGKFEGSPDVFLMNEEKYTFGDMTMIDVMDRFVHIPNIADVKTMDITINGNTTSYKMDSKGTDDTEDDQFYVGQTLLKEDGDFRDFYQAVIGVMANDLRPQENPTGQAEMTVVFTQTKGDSTVKVEYIKRDVDSYYAVKNGKYTGIIVKKKMLDTMAAAVTKINDAAKNQK